MLKNRLLSLYRANAKRGTFAAEGNVIWIYDMIVGSDWEAEMFGGISPEAFAKTIGAMRGAVHLRINSPGGDVFAGQSIAQAIREYPDGVIAHVDGVAASIASIIAVAAPQVIMAPGSMMMIHKASTVAIGNSDEMLTAAALLEKVDGILADTYAAKTTQDSGVFAELMAKETWFSAEEAVEAGLATEIASASDSTKAVARWDMTAFDAAPAFPDPPPPPPRPAAPSIEQRMRMHAVRQLFPSA